MKITYYYRQGEFAKAFEAKYQPMARAATGAMVEATGEALRGGRASIAAAGGRFGRNWQNALQSRVFPSPPKISAGPAGLIWLKSKYGGIFEYGGTISGSPWLWLPLEFSPKTIGGVKMTPKLFRERVGPLQFIHPPGKPPMLVARIDSRRQHRDSHGGHPQAVTLAALRRGATMRSGYRTVPIFIGLPKVTMRPRFGIRAAAEAAAAKLPALYYRNLKDD